jgi:hypothetical protein
MELWDETIQASKLCNTLRRFVCLVAHQLCFNTQFAGVSQSAGLLAAYGELLALLARTIEALPSGEWNAHEAKLALTDRWRCAIAMRVMQAYWRTPPASRILRPLPSIAFAAVIYVLTCLFETENDEFNELAASATGYPTICSLIFFFRFTNRND